MVTRNSETNAYCKQLFKAEFTAPVSGERRNDYRKLQLAVANCGDLLLHRPVVQLDMHVRHCLLILPEKPRHYSRGHERKIPDVQFGLALTADRPRFQHGFVGALQNRARFTEEGAAGV